MTLEAIYYIGQTIAVVAILASLIFVGMQVRQNTKQSEQANTLARAQNRRELVSQYKDVFKIASEKPEALAQIRECHQNYNNAPPEAQLTFAHYTHQFFIMLEQALYLKMEGLLDDTTLESVANALLVTLAMPGGRQFWEQSKLTYNADMRSHVDLKLEERGALMPPLGQLFPFFGSITAKPLKQTAVTKKNE